MFTREYEWYIRHLMEHVGLNPGDVMFVENVADWCGKQGISEPDGRKPLKLVSRNGSAGRLVIAELIPEEVMEERINALAIRSQLKSVTFDRAEKLNSNTKKLAYLFLSEYVSHSPEFRGDDLAADEWVFEQMDHIGMLRV
jgi:hypothetical protein